MVGGGVGGDGSVVGSRDARGTGIGGCHRCGSGSDVAGRGGVGWGWGWMVGGVGLLVVLGGGGVGYFMLVVIGSKS